MNISGVKNGLMKLTEQRLVYKQRLLSVIPITTSYMLTSIQKLWL